MAFTKFGCTNTGNLIRTIIIDDEAHVRETLTQLVKIFCPQVQLVGEAFSVESGAKAIRELHPQLVLLDIRMGHGRQFDLLKKFESI